MGSLYKRGRVWWLKYHHNGKPIRESSDSAKKMVAKRLLQQREAEIGQGKLPGVYFDRITFDELAEDFLTDYRINHKKSIERAGFSVAQLEKDFSGRRATAIDAPLVKKYIERRIVEGAKNATINRELGALKRMLNLGKEAGKVDRCPHIPKLREDNIRTGFFEHSEFLKLHEALPSYLQGFVTFAYRSGWRKSEIAGLRWSQVDRSHGIVTLDPGETKNDAGRLLYLDTELRAVINRQWNARKQNGKITPLVFTNSEGTGPIRDIRWYWEKACAEATLGKRLFHDFRRTAIRNMIRAGIPERVAMMISGHKSRSIFDRYNIVSDVDLRMAAQRQEAYLAEKPSTLGTILGTISTFPPQEDIAGKSASPVLSVGAEGGT